MRISVLIVPTLWLFCAGCTPQKKVEYSSFESSLYRIETRIVDLTTEASLFNSSEFISMSDNPEPNFENALTVLSEERFSDQQKAICIFMMYKLKRNTYLDFVKRAAGLYDAYKINDLLLSFAIKPPLKQTFTYTDPYKQALKAIILNLNRKSNYFDNLIKELEER